MKRHRYADKRAGIPQGSRSFSVGSRKTACPAGRGHMYMICDTLAGIMAAVCQEEHRQSCRPFRALQGNLYENLKG